MSANEKQVGGNHYKGLGDCQHWDVVYRLNWCYLVGAATKYLWRLGKKGDATKQIEDIGKAIHYLEKKREQLINEITPFQFSPSPVDPRKEMDVWVQKAWRVCETCKKNLLECRCGEATSAYVKQD